MQIAGALLLYRRMTFGIVLVCLALLLDVELATRWMLLAPGARPLLAPAARGIVWRVRVPQLECSRS